MARQVATAEEPAGVVVRLLQGSVQGVPVSSHFLGRGLGIEGQLACQFVFELAGQAFTDQDFP